MLAGALAAREALVAGAASPVVASASGGAAPTILTEQLAHQGVTVPPEQQGLLM